MAPTEQTILTAFLLGPSSLTTILTYTSFVALFPRGQQSSPEIQRIYRALQHRRALITDAVAQTIDDQLENSNSLLRAVVKARRVTEKEELDEEIAIEKALFGSTSNLPHSRPHTLSSILPSLESAVQDISTELQSLEEDAAALLADIDATVSGLSDLRYGKLSNGGLNQELLESLKGLKEACDR